MRYRQAKVYPLLGLRVWDMLIQRFLAGADGLLTPARRGLSLCFGVRHFLVLGRTIETLI